MIKDSVFYDKLLLDVIVVGRVFDQIAFTLSFSADGLIDVSSANFPGLDTGTCLKLIDEVRFGNAIAGVMLNLAPQHDRQRLSLDYLKLLAPGDGLDVERLLVGYLRDSCDMAAERNGHWTASDLVESVNGALSEYRTGDGPLRRYRDKWFQTD